MPNRKRRSRGPFRRQGSGWVSNLKPNIVRAPFQAFFQNAMTAGALQLSVAADNFANNITSMALVYQNYRFVELEYELLPRPASSNILVAGYYPDATVTSPAGPSTAMENLDAIAMPATGHQTVPVKHRVPLARLRGQLQWYKCTDDASDIEFDTQGIIVFTGTGTELVNCIVRGVCEFKNPVDASAGLQRMRSLLEDSIPSTPSYVLAHSGLVRLLSELDSVDGESTDIVKSVNSPPISKSVVRRK